jgi:hypothetical protein
VGIIVSFKGNVSAKGHYPELELISNSAIYIIIYCNLQVEAQVNAVCLLLDFKDVYDQHEIAKAENHWPDRRLSDMSDNNERIIFNQCTVTSDTYDVALY